MVTNGVKKKNDDDDDDDDDDDFLKQNFLKQNFDISIDERQSTWYSIKISLGRGLVRSGKAKNIFFYFWRKKSWFPCAETGNVTVYSKIWEIRAIVYKIPAH